MATNEQVFAAIIMSIIATSLFIGLVNLAYNDKFPDLSNTATVVPNLAGFDTTIIKTKQASSGITIPGQDYTNESGWDANISINRGGDWAHSSIGYTLIFNIFSLDPLITLKNVKPDGIVYTVNYLINNTPDQDFYLTPRYLVGGKTESDLRIEFKSDGIHIPKYPRIFGIWYAGDDYFFPLSNSQRTIPGGSTITTTLTDVFNGPGSLPYAPAKNSQLAVSKDGIPLFSVYVRDLAAMSTQRDFSNLPPLTIGELLDHAGAGSHDNGFTIVSIKTPIQYIPGVVTTQGEAGFYEAIVGFINLMVSFLTAVGLFISSLGTILSYSISSEICPIWATAIVMTPQLAALVLIIVKILRGTS